MQMQVDCGDQLAQGQVVGKQLGTARVMLQRSDSLPAWQATCPISTSLLAA